MANKEERIYILKVSVCKGGQEKDWEDCGCFIDDTGFCKYHPKCKHSLTRQEAIEIMAKAICWEKEHYPFEELPQYAIDYYIKQAEAALNALLEGVEK